MPKIVLEYGDRGRKIVSPSDLEAVAHTGLAIGRTLQGIEERFPSVSGTVKQERWGYTVSLCGPLGSLCSASRTMLGVGSPAGSPEFVREQFSLQYDLFKTIESALLSKGEALEYRLCDCLAGMHVAPLHTPKHGYFPH